MAKSNKSPAIGSREWLETVDEDEQVSCVQHLLEAARGASLVLRSLGDDPCVEGLDNIIWGLAAALRRSADEVHYRYFRSAGDLADTLAPDVLAALLKRELGKVQRRRKFKRERAK